MQRKTMPRLSPQHDQNDGYIFCVGDGKEYVGNIKDNKTEGFMKIYFLLG